MRGGAGDDGAPVLVVTFLVAVGAVGTGVGPAAATVPAGQSQTGAQIVVTQEHRLTPDQPGRIDVQWQLEVPSEVSEVSTRIPPDAENVRAEGFAGSGGREYEWDGRTEGASLIFTVPANETGAATGPEGSDGRYVFVDAGEWAVVRTYQAPISFTYRQGTDVSIVRRNTSAGPGVVGGAMAFLGAQETERRTVANQTVRLVVPDAADLHESRAEILGSVTAAAEALRVRDRDEEVLIIAAPDTVAWGVEGLQSGERDFYVTADEPLDTPRNVWLHEYVHTRQDFETVGETEWLTEATAQYYAAQLTLRQERIEFERFRRHLERGADGQYADVVLADERTWGASGNYDKGALVAGDLDRRIRLATNGTKTFEEVFRRMNDRDGAFTQSAFLELIDETGGEPVADRAREYTETADAPSMWSRDAHRDAFGQLPASARFREPGRHTLATNGDQHTVEGRRPAELSVTELRTDRSTVGVEEEVALTVGVENAADRPGETELVVRRDGEPVARRTVRLTAGDATAVTVPVELPATGSYTLAAGGRSIQITARTPTDETSNVRTETTAANDGASGASGPGFGVVAALAALAAGLSLLLCRLEEGHRPVDQRRRVAREQPDHRLLADGAAVKDRDGRPVDGHELDYHQLE